MDNYKTVTESNKTIRALARQTLKGKWMQALLAMLLCMAIGSLPVLILTALFPTSDFVNILTTLYSLFVSGPLNLGVMSYFLKVFRQQECSIKSVTDGFSYFRNAMGVYILMMIKIFLWSMLFVIPGIVASIRYSQAWFVLADDPNKDPNSCIEESKQMMLQNKAKYFMLCLSFIGWMLLASVPQALIEAMASGVTADGVIRVYFSTLAFGSTTILSFIASLLTLFVRIYLSTAYACFYDILRGNLVIMQPDAADAQYAYGRPPEADTSLNNPFGNVRDANPFNDGESFNVVDVDVKSESESSAEPSQEEGNAADESTDEEQNNED